MDSVGVVTFSAVRSEVGDAVRPEYVVVDLDGTLIHGDSLLETLLQVAKRQPWHLLALPFWWAFGGRSKVKQKLARLADITGSMLAYRGELIAWLKQQRTQGRSLILATAADRQVADAVAGHLGLFGSVLASDGAINRKGHAKLAAVQAIAGNEFCYVGDSRADLPLWRAASSAVLVDLSVSVRNQLPDTLKIEREFSSPSAGLSDWRRAIRVHQWLKNLLVFVPLLTAYAFTPAAVVMGLLAFLSFSLVASSTYLLNDLLDLEADRAHPRKCRRPLASGKIGIGAALLVGPGLLAAGLGVALLLPAAFGAWLLAYLALTLAYSWELKRYVLIDVIILGALYTLRILAGAAAIGVSVSFWLLAFSMAMFLSLALVKRCAELILLSSRGAQQARGRDYANADLPLLIPLGIASGLGAVLVFLLFLRDHDTGGFGDAQELWLLAPLLIYWIGRLWIKTLRGEMHDDPLVFAVRDFGSRTTIVAIVALALLAHFTNVSLL